GAAGPAAARDHVELCTPVPASGVDQQAHVIESPFHVPGPKGSPLFLAPAGRPRMLRVPHLPTRAALRDAVVSPHATSACSAVGRSIQSICPGAVMCRVAADRRSGGSALRDGPGGSRRLHFTVSARYTNLRSPRLAG